jgi:hypothetical protein
MAQLINEAKRFQKLAGIIKESQLDPRFHNAILKAASALDTLLTMSSLDTVARQAIEDVRHNILPGLAVMEESQMNEEEKKLDPQEQELVDAVLNGALKEGIDINKIIKRVKALASNGLLTAAMASTILVSCGTAGSSNDILKREIENARKVKDLEMVQQNKIDSVTASMIKM